MSTDFWIIGGIALLVILLLVAILVVIGRKHAASKTVSFDKKEDEEPKQLTQQEKSGNYQAKGGFNFAPGGAADASVAAFTGGRAGQPEKQPVPREEPKKQAPAPQPAPSEKHAAPAASERPTPRVTEPIEPTVPPRPSDEAGEAAEPARPAEPETARPEAPQPVAEQAPEESVVPAPAQEIAPEAPEEEKPKVDEETEATEATEAREDAEPEAADVVEAVETPEAAESAEPTEDTAPPATPEPQREAEEAEKAQEAAAAAAATARGAEEALEQTPAPEPEAERPAEAPQPQQPPAQAQEPEEPQEEIAPAAGRLGRLRGRLSRSQNMIGKSVLGILSAGDLDEDAWEEIEDTLVMADLGTTVTTRVVEDLREKIAERGVASEAEARAMLRETLIEACQPGLDRSIKAMPYEGKPAVVLVVGVNGTGKTTTTGKLARVLVSMGHKVVLGAADTFRAAAADQLETWGRRVGAQTVRGAEGADPASVAFDAVAHGVSTQADVVLVDTAGRLHTSVGLMDQLGKVKRVVEKKAKVDEVLLVLDATVGQNGLMQARTFSEVVDITGVVLTKLDGTAKGGIVFKVQEELGVPVKLVGLGEGSDDLAPFEVEGFVDALLGESA
ncbi:signal recognition particle-docking protein FtsY [Corynebacterium mastitidis]|uniref:signal recognition particle-docking protein FtsY n=1 Tax=Corynebacterium mastitidis TaxID=161890 RepID=UPI00037D25A6|nr:signal recognition particle-docking protein FtsY [Corynebacterium mastitidis]